MSPFWNSNLFSNYTVHQLLMKIDTETWHILHVLPILFHIVLLKVNFTYEEEIKFILQQLKIWEGQKKKCSVTESGGNRSDLHYVIMLHVHGISIFSAYQTAF